MLAIDTANGVDLVHALLLIVRFQLFINLWPFHQRLQNIQHGVNGPHVLLNRIIEQGNLVWMPAHQPLSAISSAVLSNSKLLDSINNGLKFIQVAKLGNYV